MKSIFKILLMVYLLSVSQSYLLAQDPAKLTCLKVLANGEVDISWQQPVNASGFENYVIYFSPNGNTYTQITTINNLATEQYLHLTANAGNASRYYFVETIYTGQPENSDTLRTIYLQLNNLNFKEAKLYWNGIYATAEGTHPTTFNIFKEYPLGNWNMIASVIDQTEYSETVIVCQDSINYKIEVENNTGCNHVSNIKGAWFKNLDEPAKPVIDSISVNENEHIVLGWQAVPNASAYIIYRFEAGIWNGIDTVYGINNTFYEDTLSNPCVESLTYSVATIDTCGSSGPKDENEQRKSLRINTLNYNACDESVQLNWNNYFGPAAEKYEIWMAEDNTAWNKIGETTAGITTFNHPINHIGSSYEYFIRAYFSSGTSTTCKRSIKTYGYQKPQFVYFANADVTPSNEVALTIEVDTNVNSCTWEIYRESFPALIRIKIANIQKSELDSYPLTYTDATATPELDSYLYSVIVLDSCGNKVLESNALKTILLTGSSISTNQNLLEWNAFEGWDAEVEKYYIFRMIDNIEPTAPTDSVDGQVLEYVDDMSLISNTSVIPVYWVQAVQSTHAPDEETAKARSNRTSIAKDSEMFMANAFRPGGYTPEFKPVFRFYNGKNYLFQIYSRWGNLIFETNNPDAGWDGKYAGEQVQTGTYIYRLVYQNLDHSSIEKKGTFTVIH